MDFGVLAEALANLSWREALIAIIAALLLYVLVAFLRMRRLKHAKASASSAASAAAQSAVAAYAAEQAPELPPEAAAPAEPAEPEFAWNEPPAEIPGQRMIDALEREVSTLRGEVGMLRAEVSQLREELQREFSHTRATQNVSPIYSDAMQMAMQGHDATTISQHCGIARAEAELVVALVRNRNDGI